MGLGFRVLKRERAVSLHLATRFKDLPVACVSDAMGRMSAAGANLRPLHAGGRMVGPALTVKTRPGDNLMVHKALLLAAPGDVIVVDGGGELTNALVGELMLSYAKAVGAAGVVINGAARDSEAIARDDFPVYAAGITHRGPFKDGPGEINGPIAIGGMAIEPGDLVVGDADGVLAVPFDAVEMLLERAVVKNEAENETLRQTREGRLDPKRWVDEQLARLGCSGF